MGARPSKRKRNHNYASSALRYHPKRVKRGEQRSWSKRRKGGYLNGA
jgi:hypothetical protein